MRRERAIVVVGRADREQRQVNASFCESRSAPGEVGPDLGAVTAERTPVHEQRSLSARGAGAVTSLPSEAMTCNVSTFVSHLE